MKRGNMDKFVETIQGHFQGRLISMGLHNIGVTSFLKKNGIFIVLNDVNAEDLHNVKRAYLKYKKKYSTPIVASRAFFEDAADVFCMETLELKEYAEVLYGENIFSRLNVSNDALRTQIEYELRSKLLSLRGAFIDLSLQKKIIDDLVYRSMYNMLLILRNLLRLKGTIINDNTLLDVFEEKFDIKLDAFRYLRDSGDLKFDKLFPMFKKYLDEVKKLVEISDKILS